MAVWVILRAIDALELLPLPNRLDLREKLGLTDEELAQWDTSADGCSFRSTTA